MAETHMVKSAVGCHGLAWPARLAHTWALRRDSTKAWVWGHAVQGCVCDAVAAARLRAEGNDMFKRGEVEGAAIRYTGGRLP
jgi:hypothetical protein